MKIDPKMKPSRIASSIALLLTCALADTPALAADSVLDDPFRRIDGGRVSTTPGSTLEDFFTAAMDYSPGLNIARERWNIGSARKDAANGQLLPQLNANANMSRNRRDAADFTGVFVGERYSVQMSQILFNWQAFSARSQAYHLENQAELEYYAELAWLLTEVAARYFDVLQAEDALTSVEAELDAIQNQVDQVQSLYDLQLTRITDLYDAQARLAMVEAERLDRQSELDLARESLRSVSGIPAGPLYRLQDTAQIPPLDGSVEEWVTRARQNNYIVQARQSAYRAAGERVSEQRGAYMPRVSLVVQQLNSNMGFDNMPINRADNTYVGVDLTVPIFSGGSARAGVREAVSQRNIAESELRQVQLEIIERTRSAYLQVKSHELRTQAARRLAESTATSYTAMQRGFELGTVTSVEVLNALRDQFRAERDLQQTRYEHIKARLLLQRESGSLTAEDLVDVGRWLAPTQPPL